MIVFVFLEIIPQGRAASGGALAPENPGGECHGLPSCHMPHDSGPG